jgi:hypothetical protein
MMFAMRPIHASNFGHWSASCLENFAIDAWSRPRRPTAGSSRRERQVAVSLRVDLVAEPLEPQVALDRGRHQAHHVAERGDLDVGRLGPRSHGVGGSAGLVAASRTTVRAPYLAR